MSRKSRAEQQKHLKGDRGRWICLDCLEPYQPKVVDGRLHKLALDKAEPHDCHGYSEAEIAAPEPS